MKKMLIIEDDQIVGSIYLRKFQVEGFQVELALDGEAGLAATLKSRPDVVILDLMLPRLNGVEVLKKLRAEPTTRDLPVVVLSNAYMSSLVHQDRRRHRAASEVVHSLPQGPFVNEQFGRCRSRRRRQDVLGARSVAQGALREAEEPQRLDPAHPGAHD